MNDFAELMDYEQEKLDKFISIKSRTSKEIKEFIDVVVSLREQPNENPQLDNRR